MSRPVTTPTGARAMNGRLHVGLMASVTWYGWLPSHVHMMPRAGAFMWLCFLLTYGWVDL